jgi:symplekin
MYRATSRPSEQIYSNFMSARERIIAFVINPSAQPQNVGIKAAAWKFVQKILVAGTRGASADPRVRSPIQTMKKEADDIATSQRKGGGPKYQYDLVKQSPELQPTGRGGKHATYTAGHSAVLCRVRSFSFQQSSPLIASDPAILHAIINILPALCKARPTIAPLIVSSMTSWTPAAMQSAGRPAMQIRAVDKTLRTVMVHLHK